MNYTNSFDYRHWYLLSRDQRLSGAERVSNLYKSLFLINIKNIKNQIFFEILLLNNS